MKVYFIQSKTKHDNKKQNTENQSNKLKKETLIKLEPVKLFLKNSLTKICYSTIK